MQRLAFVLAALLALPADAGWQKVSSGWVKLSDGGGTSTPATCTTAGQVPIFLGSPLALGCDAGLTYASASDTLTVKGTVTAGNYTTTALGTPTVTSPLTVNGTPGSTTYGYKAVAFLNDGTSSAASAEVTVATGPATLNGTDNITVAVPAVTGMAYYNLYRTTPLPLVKIYSGVAPSYIDVGTDLGAATLPSTNTTGRVLVGDGSAAAPSVAPTRDGTTGFAFSPSPGAGAIDMVLAGNSVSYVSAGRFNLRADTKLHWDNDTFVSSPATSILQLGPPPNATPVLNTLLVGESGAGTDIAGGGGVVASAPGTGSGAPSVLTFKTPTVHGSDAVAQTLDTRLSLQEGHVNIPGLPVFADNTAAAALNVGDLYRTSTGVLMVRY